MKTLDDVKTAMGTLYEQLNTGQTERAQAAELANIAGKWLKAEQLKLAREIFEDDIGQRAKALDQPTKQSPRTDASKIAIAK